MLMQHKARQLIAAAALSTATTFFACMLPAVAQTPVPTDTPIASETTAPVTTTNSDTTQHFDYGILGLLGLVGLAGLMRRPVTATTDYTRTTRP
jgi:hypothetical protein